MRWFWSRRKGDKTPVSTPAPAAEPVGAMVRGRRTGTLVAGGEPKNALLRYARDYLLACGARVRMEGEEVLSATLPDGSAVRYTTSLARARAEEEMRYLAEGSAALAEMLERGANEARLTAVRLAPAGDAVALALAACAEPAAGCGRCLAADADGEAGPRGVPACAECPLREGRLLFAGLVGKRRAEVMRAWEAQGAELIYLLAGRNRQGRQDEWVRVAVVDETGRACPPLAPAVLARAEAAPLAATAAEALASATRVALAELAPVIEAAARYLRLRTEEDYHRRIEETLATSRRLRGEEPDRAREIDAALDRELAALAEVFAVEVEARLESVCLITAPVAEVRLRGAKRGELTLLVDRGRGTVLPPLCGECGQPCTVGSVCGEGHVRCAACEQVCAACGERTCPECAEGEITVCASCGAALRDEPAAVSHSGRAGARRVPSGAERDSHPTRRTRVMDDGATLAIAHLEAMTLAIWRACAAWLLERVGYALDLPEERGELLVWRGRREDGAVLAAALRPRKGWPLEAEQVRRVAALAAGMAPRETVLLSPALPTVAAIEEGKRLGVRLLAGPALADLLAGVATAHQRERAQAREDGQQRAEAALTARKTLLAALRALEGALRKVGKAKPAAARAAVVTAAREVVAARQSAARALLAWETLVGDWLAAFGDRAERDGTLRLAGDEASYTELSERGGHLREALGAAIQQLQRTPVQGELEYDVWRALVLEELALRLEALRERVRMVDPARWQDFTAARDLAADAAATRATTNADRAAARAEQAYAQLAQRVGLEK